MNEDKLAEFLTRHISQFKELEVLADAVMKVSEINSLGDIYRTLIERVNEAWKAADATYRKNVKLIERNPAGRKDARLAWFYSVHSALQKASSHGRPPVNSRQMQRIFDAAYVIRVDLSSCRCDLEKQFATV